MYTRTVHLDMHMAEVLEDRARQEMDFCVRVHGPRGEWGKTMTQEERDKVRGPAMTLARAASHFRSHRNSEEIQELLMTGVRKWGATKEEMKQFRSHLPGGIKLILDTPAPKVKQGRGAKTRRRRRRR